MPRLTLVQSFPGLAFAPVYLAREAGYFADEDIDLDWRLVWRGARAVGEIVAGTGQLAASAAGEILIARQQGQDVIGIAGITMSLAFNWAASNRFMERTGLTPASPVDERIAGLKGARLGVRTRVGMLPQIARSLLRTHGIDPDTDVEWIEVGPDANWNKQFENDSIDAFFSGVPDAEAVGAQGAGAVYIAMAREIPTFTNFIAEAVSVRRDWAEQHPELVQKAARAIGRAHNLMLDDEAAAKRLLLRDEPDLSAPLLDAALAQVPAGHRRNARMSQEMWRNLIDVLTTSGWITAPLSSAEGDIWTNQYLPPEQ